MSASLTPFEQVPFLRFTTVPFFFYSYVNQFKNDETFRRIDRSYGKSGRRINRRLGKKRFIQKGD